MKDSDDDDEELVKIHQELDSASAAAASAKDPDELPKDDGPGLFHAVAEDQQKSTDAVEPRKRRRTDASRMALS